jgi:choline-sulfatase
MKWRMRLLVGAIVTAIAGAAMAGWLIARTSPTPFGPVILISIDSLRPDRLGAYRSRRATTPNLDALAAEGVVFERAYSHSPLTVPAHMSILSGRLPFEIGARDDEGYVLPEKLPLLPALLHRRGFKTAGIVSSPLLGRETRLASAFDFFDDEVPARSPSTPPGAVCRDGAATLAVAERWVEQQGTRFFLFLHLDEVRESALQQAGPDSYDAAVRRADQLAGRFVQFLKARDLYDRAVIVLVSDHGEALGDHGESGHGLFLYDATMRTPLVVKLPKSEGAGRRRTEVVQHVDVAATILDLMGAPRPSGARGRSLRHLLTSDDATLGPAPVYAETNFPRNQFGWAALTSVTDGRYRFIRAPRPELYDLTQDRVERDNLADSRPEKVAELSNLLDKFGAAAAPAAPAVLTEEDRQALLALLADPRAAASPARSAGVAARPGDPQAAEPASPADPKDRLPVLEKLRRADALARERRFAEAITGYRDIEAIDPGIPAAWRASAALLLASGQAREALDAFRRLVQLRPDDAPAVAGAARALARLGRLDEAARVAAFAARLDPVSGNEVLVRLDLRRKDYPGARMAADAAKQADPDSPLPALTEGVELYQAGKYEEALARLEEAVQLTASRRVQIMDIRFYAGDALARVRRYSDAEARLLEELKWFPESVRARESLASVYQATGRAAEIPALALDTTRALPTPDGYVAAARLSILAGDKKAADSLRVQGRQLFGEAALRAAEQLPR